MPGTVITDALFDELRDGTTIAAQWVNSFGTAERMQAACDAHVPVTGTGAKTALYKHTALKLYEAYHSRRNYARQVKGEVFTDAVKLEMQKRELEYARVIARVDRKAQKAMVMAKQIRSLRAHGKGYK